MKIVFIASIAGKEHLEENYHMISDLCQKNGHDVYDDYTFKHTPAILAKSSISNLKRNYKKITAKIKACDIVIAETTQSSTGVGRYIGVALQYHKPVLVLYTTYPPRALLADPTRLITIKKYNPHSIKVLEAKLHQFFIQAENKLYTYRFNIMLSNEINEYLHDKSKENNVSKADYLRNLIVNDMAANTEED